MPRPQLNEVGLDDPLWLEFVSGQAEATAFHHPAWASFVSEAYGYPARALLLADSSGSVRAGLPVLTASRPVLGQTWVCLPFTDYCPPLAVDDTALEDLSVALADWQARYRRKLRVRAPLPPSAGLVPDEAAAVRHTLQLAAPPETLFRGFKKTQVQQCIVKAERAGVVVRRAESLADMRQYYQLHLATRHRLGAPAQPRRFFDLLWERLLDRGLGFVLLAEHAGACIAGAVFLGWNGTLLYKYSASDSRHWQLRPNNLVLWTAIR